MSLLLALLAMLVQPQPLPADFIDAIVACEVPVVEWGTFVGCTTASEDDAPYAGAIWIDGALSLETGP